MKTLIEPNTPQAETSARLHPVFSTLTALPTEELLHQLQIHQSELEIQNDELLDSLSTLEEALNHYMNLYDSSPVGYLILTPDGLITEINLTAAGLLGVDRSKRLASYFSLFVTSQESELWTDFFTDIMKCNQRQAIELTLKRSDDTAFPVLLDCLCINSMLRITVTDITQIKKADAVLREVETHTLAIALASAEMGSWDWDIKTGHVIFNERCGKMRGYPLKEKERHFSTWENDIHPNDFQAYHDALTVHLENKTPFFQAEYRVRTLSGTLVWVMSRGTVINRDSEGSPLRMAGIEMDITERRHREQQDKEHLNQLAHVTRLGLMGEMASGIAHEINQPLAAISTYAQVSLTLINTENPNLIKLREIISKTQEQALRAGQIIHNMKGFLKSDTTNNSASDINTLIHHAASMCIADLKQHNIKLIFKLNRNLPIINVDQIQIEQIIINLIRNSADALNNSQKKQEHKISIHSKLTVNKEIEVMVKDNGSGLSDDQQQKIFTPFYTTKTNGMGMGLSISQSLINAHKGMLYFNSTPGKGSRFYFTLPIP